MHPDNKLTNHGKQVSSDSQSQLPNVTQGANKGLGAGNHGLKANQISPGNPGLKAVNQSVSGIGGMMKTKRERSVSMESGEQQDTLTSLLETGAKEGVMRSKRRCVLEKKQPYSGDEWCSGPDTEEEDDKPHTVAHRERVMSSGIRQGLSGPSSTTGPLPPDPSLTPGVGRGLGPGGHRSEVPRPSQQVVYVFTTSLANSAAEAVIHGHTDSILLFHQQNVPRTKQLEQYAPSGKHPSLSELSARATPPTGTPKSQSGTPRPASVGVGSHLQSVRSGTPSSTGPPESETPQTRPGGPGASNNSSSGPSLQPSGAIAPTSSGTGSGGGGEGDGSSPSGSPSVLSSHLQGDVDARGGPGANRDDGGLSREQLEHRERSLQTLRDIERLLLRSGTAGGPGEPPGPCDDDNNNSNVNNNNNRVGGGPAEDSDNAGSCDNNGGGAPLLTPGGQVKRYEEPLQSMVSQTQQLGGPGLDDSPMRGAHHHHHHHHHHHLPPHHHHLHSPGGLDMGPLLGPDGLTPEQVAWRKLQEEYYQEKRRQQEIQPSPHTHPQHFRMMQEMGIGHGAPAIMMRGPPPPYHSKPGEQQWGPGGPMMGPGGMGPGNPRMIDMHPDGPRGPRFLGQMQRGPPGSGGFPGSPGGVLAMEGLGPQRGPRPGMWIEDLPPNMMGGGGGPFYHGGPGGGPQQHLQGDPERLLTREEMFRIMEKRQLQGLHRLELERIAKQQQQGIGGPRMMEGPGGFPGQGMGRGPGSRGDPMDFPGSREMMGSPGGGGPQMRDLMDSPLGPGGMGMNMMNQQMMLQKMRGGGGGGPLGDMLTQEDIARIRAAQNGGGRGGGKVMNQGPDGPLQFPNQGPFPGGPGGGDGGYLQGHGAEMFGGPDQHEGPHMGGTSRLSHMPMGGRPRGHPSDLSVNVNPGMLSPAMPPPPHQLKSPPLTQEPSPLMSSPSAPGLKSPSQVSSGGGPQAQQHPLPPASGAGTPSSMKSPQVMGPTLGLRSPSGSPGRLKSPVLVSSPGWTSPKTALPSPGGPVSGKGVGNGGSSSTETGPSLPPRSSNSTPISQPGSMAPSMPFTSSPDNPPTQNPLSLIMSQMSKYAMPSSTPLYHDAIKTIATSDDEMTPDRPLLSGVNIGGNLGNHQGSMLLSQSSMGPHSGPQSPLGMVLQGPSQLSPNPMGLPGMNPSMMGGGGGPPDGMGSSMSPMHPHNQMGGFPRMQNPSHGGPLHSPLGGLPPQFSQQNPSHGGPLHSPLGGLPPQFSQQNPDDVIPPLQHMLSKGLPHPQQHAPPPSDSFMGPEGPDLSDVIRPTHSGIPEFDLSRIIPSDKPSSTLQYFPKAEGQGGPPNPQQGRPGSQGPPPQLLKQLSTPSSNPHIANLQNMMAEQQLPPLPSHCGMGRPGMAGGPQGGSRGMGGPGGGCMMPPGHLMGRTGMGPGPGGQQLHHHHHHQHHHQQQQAMMANSLLHPGPHPSMMSPQHQQHHSMMAQQNLMLMQAKQRSMGLPGDPFGQQGGPLMSPGGPMMGPGPQHPQGGMIGPGAGPQGPLRQRGMSLDSPIGYGPGPGSMTNMPF
ncbi:B-cell CLL/lymphoma 9-like protein isoform X2 [Esox lucius]|uniref:B-cell lymphoma 9 beta-catenin binding domain-containing protein n=1 Tax=Esox lucius TaxID=8010 RepID=A0A3P8Z4J7_ESOLU|nr:B-cell CLL/lymphoma 9-like protein isoform X2 [Esox lucius]